MSVASRYDRRGDCAQRAAWCVFYSGIPQQKETRTQRRRRVHDENRQERLRLISALHAHVVVPGYTGETEYGARQ